MGELSMKINLPAWIVYGAIVLLLWGFGVSWPTIAIVLGSVILVGIFLSLLR